MKPIPIPGASLTYFIDVCVCVCVCGGGGGGGGVRGIIFGSEILAKGIFWVYIKRHWDSFGSQKNTGFFVYFTFHHLKSTAM